jgi:hypothetical protein
VTEEEIAEVAAQNWPHLEEIKKLRASYANQVFVQPMGDGNLRLNFGETLDEESLYHTAVVLSYGNAIELSSLIQRMVAAAYGAPPVFQPGPEITEASSNGD